MTSFDNAIQVVLQAEGGFTADPTDRGNWTGGEINKGVLAGTKYGISAAEYPLLDIRNLTLDVAKRIYRRDYWVPCRGDDLPPVLAMLVFDAAVNDGIGRAIHWLQETVGVTVDGDFGPITLAAVLSANAQSAVLYTEYMSRRLMFMAASPEWLQDSHGYARRLFRLAYSSDRMLGS